MLCVIVLRWCTLLLVMLLTSCFTRPRTAMCRTSPCRTAEAANARSFIEALPEKYNTKVGEGGPGCYRRSWLDCIFSPQTV